MHVYINILYIKIHIYVYFNASYRKGQQFSLSVVNTEIPFNISSLEGFTCFSF